jgi:DNA-binding response OmpR family regulator
MMMKKKILFIDDIVEFRQLTSSILQNEYDVILASNGLEAMERIHSNNLPDLIVTDLSMPKMDGELFIKKIKEHDSFSHIPIVVLSSVDSSKDRIRLLEAGVCDFIVKPFNPTELLLRLRLHLKRSA